MALVDLAYYAHGKPLSLTEIAQRQVLPLTYLEQLFVTLRQKGFVSSTRGPQGGYVLAREAETIRIAEILEAIGEPLQTTRCRRDAETGCLGTKGHCLTHALWAGLGQQMHQYLNGISLADVCSSDFEEPDRRPSGEPDERSDLRDQGRIPKGNDPGTRKAKSICERRVT